jgi:hemolysin D
VQRLKQQTLTASIDGTIQQLDVHTIGGVVTPAQTLAVVVPDDANLIIEAHVANQDVGFVRAGQEAQVKIEAFSFTRYGLVTGYVVDISRDTVENSRRVASPQKSSDYLDDKDGQQSGGYIAHIALEKSEIMTERGVVSLSPGMAVTAEIKTGKRRVIDYIMSPILKYKQDSMRER